MHDPKIDGTRFRAGFVYNMGDEEARSLVVLVVLIVRTLLCRLVHWPSQNDDLKLRSRNNGPGDHTKQDTNNEVLTKKCRGTGIIYHHHLYKQ